MNWPLWVVGGWTSSVEWKEKKTGGDAAKKYTHPKNDTHNMPFVIITHIRVPIYVLNLILYVHVCTHLITFDTTALEWISQSGLLLYLFKSASI